MVPAWDQKEEGQGNKQGFIRCWRSSGTPRVPGGPRQAQQDMGKRALPPTTAVHPAPLVTGLHLSTGHMPETWRWRLGCAKSEVSNSCLSIFRTLPSFKQTATPERWGCRDSARLRPLTSCLTGRSVLTVWLPSAKSPTLSRVLPLGPLSAPSPETQTYYYYHPSSWPASILPPTSQPSNCLLGSTPLPGLLTTLLSIP